MCRSIDIDGRPFAIGGGHADRDVEIVGNLVDTETALLTEEVFFLFGLGAKLIVLLGAQITDANVLLIAKAEELDMEH